MEEQSRIELTYEARVEGLESLADFRFAGCHIRLLLRPAFLVGLGFRPRLLECLFSGLEFGFKFVSSLRGNGMGGL
jgi:hypothetical protein